MNQEEADSLKAQLEEAGASVELRGRGPAVSENAATANASRNGAKAAR